ncbi:IclR family transcriptional regulator [Halobacillus amylolyticus]|uniref:IclR family transcriptional regulator n=1 Tax=Halobacillus amylolyticus TaxID=2932259 RepID=A0ABY4HAP2_9BACI|nr:IclR family transcriptional regulator [Halobacillus amylolyticus]UOR11517.1 IclR family transcriptional regulator [Halobacillus amylolyticus]
MTVKSADRVINILDLLKEFPEGLTLKEIADRLSLPQSSTFHLLQTMEMRQFLSVTERKTYKLGPKLIQIGTRALETLDVNAEAQPYLRQLMENVEETVFMAVMLENELVYVAKVDNYRSVRTSAQIGMRKPMYCTGLGKAFLAFLPEQVKNNILSQIEMPAITKNTITDQDALNEQLLEFRRLGYSIDDEENEGSLYCLAAPIYNAAGEMTAAVSVAGPKNRVYPRQSEIVKELLSTAKAISERTGF